MDGRTTANNSEPGRQFEWPPPESIGIADGSRDASRAAMEFTVGDATYSSQPAVALRQPAANRDNGASAGAGRWRRVGVRTAAIGTIGVIALLGQGSATSPRERNAASGSTAAAVDATLPAAPTAEPAAETGRPAGGSLTVPGPTGARVWVDGTSRGTAPLSITNLAPGTHEVRVVTNSAVASERVSIAAGSIATFVVSWPTQRLPARTLAPSKPPPVQPLVSPGTVAVALPFDVQIFENGRFAGTSSAEVILPPGSHRLELVNKSLNYQVVESVLVESDKAVKIPAAAPMGSVSVNALPWAEVFIDGRKVGETPLGQVPIAVGAHEIVFRHPQLGEQSRSLTVTAGGPTRLSVDLRK